MTASPGPGSGSDTGAVALIAVLTVTAVLVIVGALAIDLGNAFARQQTSQTAADLAALAGAKELPDVPLARAAAIASLCTGSVNGNANENTVQGWPAAACDSTAWAQDGDLANGEIEFFGADGNGNGFLDDGVLRAGVTRAGADDDERVSGGPATSIRIVTPRATVPFQLASLVGIDSVDVQRAATAVTATPAGLLGIAPFYLLDTEDEQAQVCFWLGGTALPPATDDSGPCGASRANRGVVDAPRATATSTPQTAANIESGVDHGIVPWTAYPVQPANPAPDAHTPCSATPGTMTTFGAALQPRTPVNCLPLVAGSLAGEATTGFLTDPAARLRRTGSCAGNANSGTVGAYTGVDANSLFQTAFVNPASGATVTQIRNYVRGDRGAPFPTALRGALSSAVLTCPRLSLVPVVSLPNSGPNGSRVPPPGAQYPVVGMRYVWFGDDTGLSIDFERRRYSYRGFVFTFPPANALIGVRAYVVDPRLLPATVTGSPVVDAWTGVDGPRQLRLTHDSADPLPEAP